MITGKMGTGKSTVASILKTYGFAEQMFARPIKTFAISAGFTHAQVYGTQSQKLEIDEFWGISAREFMQKFGSEVGRTAIPQIIPDMKMNSRTLWARIVEKKITKDPLMVLSDGRFPDEAKLVKDHGGIIIKITRDNVCGCEVVCVGPCVNVTGDHGEHQSETAMDEIVSDYHIINNGSMEDLETVVKEILINENVDVSPLLPKFSTGRSATINSPFHRNPFYLHDNHMPVDCCQCCSVLARSIRIGRDITMHTIGAVATVAFGMLIYSWM